LVLGEPMNPATNVSAGLRYSSSGVPCCAIRHGLLDRVAYQDDRGRGRHEYRLTDKGRDLFPVIVALMQWGDRWTADDSGPAVQLLHRDCGEPVTAELTCGAGHVALGARDVMPVPGPGAIAVA
jgi:hypothetical protein